MDPTFNSDIRIESRYADSGSPSAVRREEGVSWERGPPPGIYVTSSWESAAAAAARYDTETDGAACYVDHNRPWSGEVIPLGPSYPILEGSGVFSPLLRTAPRGALIVMGPVILTEFYSLLEGEKVRAACSRVFEGGFRIILVVRTPRNDLARGDLLLTLRYNEPDVMHLESAFRGIVDVDGRLIEATPFREVRPRPPSSWRPRSPRRYPPRCNVCSRSPSSASRWDFSW